MNDSVPSPLDALRPAFAERDTLSYLIVALVSIRDALVNANALEAHVEAPLDDDVLYGMLGLVAVANALEESIASSAMSAAPPEGCPAPATWDREVLR